MFGYSLLFQKYIEGILVKYKEFKDTFLTSAIGFTGTVNEIQTVYTPKVDNDCLIFGFNVDFSNSGVLLRIEDGSTGYNWNVLQPTGTTQIQGTPITAMAGITTQVMPVLSLICPFFLARQSQLKMDFRNSAAGATTGGNISAVGVRLFS